MKAACAALSFTRASSRLNHAALSDRSVPRFIARCAPEEAAIAAPLAARLGPRVSVRADPAFAAGNAQIDEA